MPQHTHECEFYPDKTYEVEDSLDSLFGYLQYMNWRLANGVKPIGHRGHWARTFSHLITGEILSVCDAAYQACFMPPPIHICCGGIGGHWACCHPY